MPQTSVSVRNKLMSTKQLLFGYFVSVFVSGVRCWCLSRNKSHLCTTDLIMTSLRTVNVRHSYVRLLITPSYVHFSHAGYIQTMTHVCTTIDTDSTLIV